MKRTLCIIMLALASCGIHRPETRDYFHEVTGIALCPGTTVRNINLDTAKQAGIGFVYEVALVMPEECEEQFYRALVRKRDGLPNDDVIQTSKDGDTIHFLYAG